MSDLLVLLVNDLPFLLEGRDQFLSLLVLEQEFLLVTLVLFFNLHFTHEGILIIDVVLDLLHVLRSLSVVALLQEVLIFVLWHLGGGEDVLDSVCNNVVLV